MNIVAVEYPPSETQKNHAGDRAEAADLKNKFLQDVDGPTFHHFSNGPSLNRIVVFQDHVGGGEVRTFLIQWYRFLFEAG